MINWKRSRVTQLRPWPPWDTNRSRPLDLGRFGDQPRIGTAHIFWNRPRIVTALKKKWWAHLSLVQKPVFDKKYHHFMDQKSSFQQSFRQTPKLRKLYTKKSSTSDPSNHYPSLFHHFSITLPSLFLVILWRYCWYVHGTWHLRLPGLRTQDLTRKEESDPSAGLSRSCRRGDVPLSSLSWSLGSLGSLDISQGWGTRL